MKVGQRVKYVRESGLEGIKRSDGVRKISFGSEGVIIAIPGRILNGTTVQGDCRVKIDDDPHIRSCFFFQLEPIQPEGNKVVSWSECLWQPNKELLGEKDNKQTKMLVLPNTKITIGA